MFKKLCKHVNKGYTLGYIPEIHQWKNIVLQTLMTMTDMCITDHILWSVMKQMYLHFIKFLNSNVIHFHFYGLVIQEIIHISVPWSVLIGYLLFTVLMFDQ